MITPGNILLATHNPGKAKELQDLLPKAWHILTLQDIQWTEDIPEPFFTFRENAQAKADTLFQHTGMPCIADDSGLEVDSLNGRPGVFSARYAGHGASGKENVDKLLEEMSDVQYRGARFVAVLAFRTSASAINYFEGTVPGIIAYQAKGTGGFGYDPVFIPDGFNHTFAELPVSLKNKISHRAQAVQKLIQFLNNLK